MTFCGSQFPVGKASSALPQFGPAVSRQAVRIAIREARKSIGAFPSRVASLRNPVEKTKPPSRRIAFDASLTWGLVDLSLVTLVRSLRRDIPISERRL